MTPGAQPRAPSGRGRTFASLSIHNYRLFWAGSLVSNTGTWMNRVAQDWLVLTILTANSASALGIVTGLQFLPIPLLAPLAGALADAFPKRNMLVVTQIAMACTAITLATLVSLQVAELWHMYVIATLTGVITALDMPARQAFVSEMVPKELLLNAVGLNSTSFNGARLIGPGLAGLLIAWTGVAPAIWINAVSFVAVIAALLAMRTDQLTPAPQRRGRGAIAEGFRYVRGRPDLQLVLVLVFVLGTFGMNFQLTNALMATEVFHVGPEGFGLLGSIMAVGSLGAALWAARRTRPRLRTMLGALLAFSAITAALALSPVYWMYAALMAPVGLAALTFMTTANTTVQLATTPALRGRVMALYLAIFQGGTPLGAPVIGWIGDVFGARWTLATGAIATGLAAITVGTALVVKHPHLRAQLRFPQRRVHPQIPDDS